MVLQYRADGARQAQRADDMVRSGIQRTARTAQREKRVVDGWFRAHRRALLGIAVATTALLAGVIAASPSLSASLGSVRLAFSLLAMEIGATWEPAFLVVEDLAWKAYDAFVALPDPVKDFIAIVLGIGVVAGVITGLAVAFIALGAVAGVSLGSVLLLFGAIILAIGIVAGVVFLLWKAWETNFLGIRDIAHDVWESVEPLLVEGMQTIKHVWDQVIHAIMVLWSLWGDHIMAVVEPVWNIIKTFFGGFFDTAITVVRAILAIVRGDFSFAMELMSGLVKRNIERIISIFASFKRAVAAAVDLAIRVFVDLVAAVKKHSMKVFLAVWGLTKRIGGVFTGLVTSAWRWGRDLLKNWVNGIKSFVGRAVSKVKGWAADIMSPLTFDIAANDRMAMRWGQDAVGFFGRGIQNELNALDRLLAGGPLPFGGQTGPAPQPTAPTGGGGTTITVILEDGAVRHGETTGSPGLDEERLAELIGRQVGERVNWRGR